jgi:hypothetical protein
MACLWLAYGLPMACLWLAYGLPIRALLRAIGHWAAEIENDCIGALLGNTDNLG